jgi:general secretion pathway protein G
MHNQARTPQGGFTLIEVMVVVAIIGLLATFVAQNVTRDHDDAKVAKARTDVRTLRDAAIVFRTKHAHWPTLHELTDPDEQGWAAVEISADPWQHDYVLHAGNRPGDFTVLSVGPDGLEGTEDDIKVGRG